MRRFHLTIGLAASLLAGNAAFAAELPVPPLKAPRDVSVHKGPPNCSRWTDECVNCSRGAADEPAVCSNIGIACQPQAIRCLSPSGPPGQPQK